MVKSQKELVKVLTCGYNHDYRLYGSDPPLPPIVIVLNIWQVSPHAWNVN